MVVVASIETRSVRPAVISLGESEGIGESAGCTSVEGFGGGSIKISVEDLIAAADAEGIRESSTAIERKGPCLGLSLPGWMLLSKSSNKACFSVFQNLRGIPSTD